MKEIYSIIHIFLKYPIYVIDSIWPFIDVSSASHTDSMDVSSYDNKTRGIEFNDDGTLMFFHGQQNDNRQQFQHERRDLEPKRLDL